VEETKQYMLSSLKVGFTKMATNIGTEYQIKGWWMWWPEVSKGKVGDSKKKERNAVSGVYVD
jgi:hypothetical protein